jgi:phosphoribosylformimino-5-aminoimidazole carboxamide ribotide isomerase
VILYPAIDLREGRCVRLVQGDFEQETSYDDDPISVARMFAATGAKWLHVVDLDAARRQGDNRDVIEALAAVVPIPIQVGGGVRDATLLARGVARVVVGSLAVEDPGAVRRLAAAYPGQVAVGLDHRDGEVRVRGWAEGSSIGIAEALAAVDCAELAAVIVTEIGRDGMLSGPDLDGLAAVLALTDTAVIASGGVSSVVDLRALAALRGGAAGGGGAAGAGGAASGGGAGGVGGGRRLAGVIVGKAIYEGRVELDGALRTLRALGAAR